MKSVITFLDYLTQDGKWPQFSLTEQGEIDKIFYAIGGSMAPKIISQANSNVVECYVDKEGNLTDSRIILISDKLRSVLKGFDEPIGDLDFIPSQKYAASSNGLKKGGWGPAFKELPEGALDCFKRATVDKKLMCDPVKAYDLNKVYIISIGDRQYVTSSLDSLLAYKVLHIFHSYGCSSEKLSKLNSDFIGYYNACKEILEYDAKHLSLITSRVLRDWDRQMMIAASRQRYKWLLNGILTNNDYNELLKCFLNEVLLVEQQENVKRPMCVDLTKYRTNNKYKPKQSSYPQGINPITIIP